MLKFQSPHLSNVNNNSTCSLRDTRDHLSEGCRAVTILSVYIKQNHQHSFHNGHEHHMGEMALPICDQLFKRTETEDSSLVAKQPSLGRTLSSENLLHVAMTAPQSL